MLLWGHMQCSDKELGLWHRYYLRYGILNIGNCRKIGYLVNWSLKYWF